MKVAAHRSVIVFGMCVMCAVLFSGCATQVDPSRVPMSPVDLNHYQINCKLKDQQVAMLQSMRQSKNDIFAARMRAMTQPFAWGPDHDIANGNANHYIDFHLRHLSYCQ